MLNFKWSHEMTMSCFPIVDKFLSFLGSRWCLNLWSFNVGLQACFSMVSHLITEMIMEILSYYFPLVDNLCLRDLAVVCFPVSDTSSHCTFVFMCDVTKFELVFLLKNDWFFLSVSNTGPWHSVICQRTTATIFLSYIKHIFPKILNLSPQILQASTESD